MARATRSTAAQPRKRKRTSSTGPPTASKLQRTDDDPPDHVFLSPADAHKILDVLELSDTQGLLDRVFPSPHAPDLLLSLRTLLEHPAEHPLTAVKAAINNLFPISSLPRSLPSPAASQQLAFSNLALSLIEQASFNAITPSLEKVDILEPSKPGTSPILAKRKYALVQHLPAGDYWSSLSSETPSSDLKNLSTGHAELVAIIPTAASVSVDSVPTLGSVSSRPLAQTKHIHGQRRVPTGVFLDYGPYASFAPCFENTGEIVGQHQLSEVIYQRQQTKGARRDQNRPAAYIEEIAEDIVMNAESVSDEDLNNLLSPEDVVALKQALGSLELENAMQHLLERNSLALRRLEELQTRRLRKGGANVKPPEEGSEEWETAQCIMDSIATLASLRPRSAEDGPPLVPSPAVLRKLHRSLALEPSPGWYGNLPATRSTALHDDSTIKVKTPTPAPAAAVPAPVPTPTPSTQAPATSGYPGYSYNYGTTQQQAYRATTGTYAPYKPGQASYYQSYATTQQAYYNPQSFAGTSNQQPYGSTAAGQTYPYGTWYNQYQPAAAAGAKSATPAASYNTFFTAGTASNGATAASRSPAVANTVANKAATPQAAGTWPATAYQTSGVTPTLPSHLRTAQSSTPTPGYQQQTGYYQAAYQTQPSATAS